MSENDYYQGSNRSYRSEFDYQIRNPTDVSVESTTTQILQPLNGLDDPLVPIQFDYKGSSAFVDLKNSKLFCEIQVLKADGSTIASDEVSCCSGLLHSLFADLEISLNGKIISEGPSLYSYRSYLQNLLENGTSELTSQLFSLDTKPSTAADSNLGYKHRKAFLTDSKTLELEGNLMSDICQVDQYIPSYVDISIKLKRNSNAFVLWTATSNPSYKIKINRCVFKLIKHAPSNDIVKLHESLIQKQGGLQWDIKMYKSKLFTVPTGNYSLSNAILSSGQLPRHVIVGFVDNKSYNGDYSLNPYNFEHFNVSQITLNIDEDIQQKKEIKCDFSNNKYLDAFNNLHNYQAENGGANYNNILRSVYASGGHCLYVFPVVTTPALNAFPPKKYGQVTLDAVFKNQIDKPITVITFGIYHKIIQITKDREISVIE
jgi:hypothetical protein